MARFTAAEAARAVGGRIAAGDPRSVIDGAAIDSRGDVVLVKGSRGVKLDRVVRRLLGESGEGAH
ncbi:MAG TPA: hypothetical protein VGM86_08380 [Thermoanaerobaculia bacterium]